MSLTARLFCNPLAHPLWQALWTHNSYRLQAILIYIKTNQHEKVVLTNWRQCFITHCRQVLDRGAYHRPSRGGGGREGRGSGGGGVGVGKGEGWGRGRERGRGVGVGEVEGWGWGVLGQVLDRGAYHHPSTRNATRIKKGVETIHFAQLKWKIGFEIRHFPHFCYNIGVETIQIFQRPEKGGRNGGAYEVTPSHPPHPQPHCNMRRSM